MPSISLTISYQINQYQVISASELKKLYFSNIPLKNPDGSPISNETIDEQIQASQKEIEDLLDIKLQKQAIKETRDYVYDDWVQWGYVPTTYPAVSAISMQGFLNTVQQVDYPQQWLSVKKTSDGELYNRSISLIPITGSTNQVNQGAIYTGIFPNIGYFGSKLIPNYWSNCYTTGFLKVPIGIMKAIQLKAAIGLLPIASQGIFLGQPGIASKSIGIDGLSQSVTSTANASKLAYGALIDEWNRQLDLQLEILKKKFVGFIFGTL